VPEPSGPSRTLDVEMRADSDIARAFALEIAPAVGIVATYCDKVEHNEPADPKAVADAGATIEHAVVGLSRRLGVDVVAAYAERLAVIETRNVLDHHDAYDGAAAARSWRDLQLVQVEHDRLFHPDVIGLHKLDQLRHYVLHLAKLVGVFAEAADLGDLRTRRLPDCLLFAIKLRTVTGTRLADEPLPRPLAGAGATAAAV
jgi:hypothetical protein